MRINNDDDGSSIISGIYSVDGPDLTETYDLAFTIHESGDIRDNCSRIGNELSTDEGIDTILVENIVTSVAPFSWTQEAFTVPLADILGRSVRITRLADGSSGDPEQVGCCVLGKAPRPF